MDLIILFGGSHPNLKKNAHYMHLWKCIFNRDDKFQLAESNKNANESTADCKKSEAQRWAGGMCLWIDTLRAKNTHAH